LSRCPGGANTPRSGRSVGLGVTRVRVRLGPESGTGWCPDVRGGGVNTRLSGRSGSTVPRPSCSCTSCLSLSWLPPTASSSTPSRRSHGFSVSVPWNSSETRMPVIAASPAAEISRYRNTISGTFGRRGSTPIAPIDSKGKRVISY